MKFICPKCRLPFVTEDERRTVCESGHSFDRAREGYFNLLLSNSGSTHGDNAEMIAARRNFLNTGAYLPLAERVSSLALSHISGDSLIDIGCGEGYYTAHIEDAFSLADKPLSLHGFDISKDAVKRAARRIPSAHLAVASAYRIPAPDGLFDMALNMFSPLALEETRRILRTDGIFIMAIPGARHLFGLKAVAYETPYENELSDKALEGFSLIGEEHILYELSLKKNSEIRDLFMMTPYAYRTRAADKERVLALDYLETSAEFHILVYKKS